MITKLTGTLNRVLDDEIRIEVGPFEYQVMIPEAVRRQVQLHTGREVTLHISEYLEGNPSGNRFIPRKIGFLHELELEFFELFCTVDKIGVKKALKAMARPVREIAEAINRQDTRWLSTLPGIGAASAEQIAVTLKKKMPKFLAMPKPEPSNEETPSVAVTKGKRKAEPLPLESNLPDGSIVEDVYETLLGLGHSPMEARNKLDGLISSGKKFASVEEALILVYQR